MLSLAAGSALAQSDKAKKQAEIRKVTAASLEKFYKAKPELKGEVGKAPEKGWEAGDGGAVEAGAAGKSVGAAGGENAIADAAYYTLTKNGIQAGGAVAGRSSGRTRS